MVGNSFDSMKKLTYKEAFFKTPGPRDFKGGILLWSKGICMGGADIIPGVSGGTIAFITGIYTQLIDAIRSFDLNFARRVISLDFREALALVHVRFLFCLLFGILTAIICMASVMHFMLSSFPVEIWSLFFGLIVASIYVVGREIQYLKIQSIGFVFAGCFCSYFLVGMIPVSTPETMPFIFFCGAIAICAMILPGISGAFLLLMLGKYEYITGMLKNPFVADHLLVLVVFATGAVAGILFFSRVIHYLLHRWHSATICMLTGFMLGALRKVWPWKETLESIVIREKIHILREQNVLPALDEQFFIALGLAIAGAVTVLLLDRLSRGGR